MYKGRNAKKLSVGVKNFIFYTQLFVPLTLSKVLSLDKRKKTLSFCFDSRTYEIKISRFYNQNNKNNEYFWFCTRLIVPLQSIMEEKNQYVRQVAEQKYEFGFTTDVQTEVIPVGLNEDIVRLISKKLRSLSATER